MSMYWYTQYISIHVLYRVQRCTMVYLKKTKTKLSIYNQIPQNKYKLEVIFFNKNFKHESSLKLILYYFRGTMVWERNSTPRIHQTLDCLLIVNDRCLQATDTIYTCQLSGTCITGHYYGYFKPFQLKHPPIHTKTCAPPNIFNPHLCTSNADTSSPSYILIMSTMHLTQTTDLKRCSWYQILILTGR